MIFRLDNRDVFLEDTLEDMKGKNNMLKEQFIKEYIPFVIKTVSKVSNKYIDLKNSDEFGVGLSAFNEAIDCYDRDKHCSFISFAEQVIKRRIIDYIRSDKKNNNVYPFTYFCNDDNNEYEYNLMTEDCTYSYENIETRHEIIFFKQNLKRFGITLEELASCTPKHKDSKLLSIEIAKKLCTDDKLFFKLYNKRKIPSAELVKIAHINKRTIERNRKFIIAVCLILKSNLTILKGYIGNLAKEGEIE